MVFKRKFDSSVCNQKINDSCILGEIAGEFWALRTTYGRNRNSNWSQNTANYLVRTEPK